MNKKNLLLLYARSNLNIVLSLSTVVLIVVSISVFTGLLRIFMPLIIFFFYIFISFFILLGRRGAQEILSEADEDRRRHVGKVITRYREMRDRISFLRIGNEEIGKTLEYFLLVSGNYLNKCRELSTYSPQANAKIEEVLGVCQNYLEEYDQQLTGKRYGIEDNDNLDEYTAKTVDIIRKAGECIEENIEEELVGLTRKEKMEIIEEMNDEE
ncbi:MAG: hypothetical protein JW881_18955 [Spirochaetales bacterium]|nr:hypothetical protein [Spirochaetales bacterium]